MSITNSDIWHIVPAISSNMFIDLKHEVIFNLRNPNFNLNSISIVGIWYSLYISKCVPKKNKQGRGQRSEKAKVKKI